MSDLSVILSCDTTGFNRAVNEAKQALERYKKEALGAAGEIGKNISVTNEQINAYERVLKSLNKVGSGQMTTAQQTKALATQIKELQIQWANLSDKAKSSDFGKSISLSISLAKAQLNQLNTQLEQTSENMSKVGGKSTGGGLSKMFNFGNVESQIQGITSSMSALGLQGGATLSALSGGAKALLNPYTATAAAVAGCTYAFVDYNNKLSEQTEKVRLFTGATGDLAIALRNQTKSISDTYGADFDETLIATNSLAKQMGISFTEASEAMSLGFASGANANGELLETVREYPAYLKEAGINATGFMSIISQSVKEGVFSDKGVDAIKEANLRLREMPKSTLDALTAIGMSSSEISKSLANGTKTTFLVVQEVSKKLQKLPDSASQVGQALADIFGGPGEDAGLQYIRMLGDIDLSEQGLLANMTEQQRATYELQQADKELEDSLASVFGVSEAGFGTMITNLKVGVYLAITKVINKFIDLYNSSMIVRGGIASIATAFKTIWAVCKNACILIGKELADLAHMLDSVFSGNVDGVAKAWEEMKADAKNSLSNMGQEFSDAMKDGFKQVSKGKINKIHVLAEVTDVDASKAKVKMGSGNGTGTGSGSKSKSETPLSKYSRLMDAAAIAYTNGLITEEEYFNQQISAIKSYVTELSKNKSSIIKNKDTIEALNTKLKELQGNLAISKVIKAASDDLEDNTTKLTDGMMSMDDYNSKYRSNLQKIIDAYYSLDTVTEALRKAQLEFIKKLKDFDVALAQKKQDISESRENVVLKKTALGMINDAVRGETPNENYTKKRDLLNSQISLPESYKKEKAISMKYDLDFDEKKFDNEFTKRYHDVMSQNGLNVDKDGLQTTLDKIEGKGIGNIIKGSAQMQSVDTKYDALKPSKTTQASPEYLLVNNMPGKQKTEYKGDKSNWGLNATSSSLLEKDITPQVNKSALEQSEEELQKFMDMYKGLETAYMSVKKDPFSDIDTALSSFGSNYMEIVNLLKDNGIEISGTDDAEAVLGKVEERVKSLGELVQSNLNFEEVKESMSQMGDFSSNFADNLANLTEISDAFKAAQDTNLKSTLRTAAGFTVAGKALGTMGSAFSLAAQAFDSKEFNVAGIIAEALATLALSFAQAMTSASSNWITWLAFGVTGLATLLTMTAQIKSATSAANGGIIKGTSLVGDHNIAMVNSGEMILNTNEQGRLFRILNGSQPYNATTAAGGNIEFTLYGEDLYGSINNYNKVHGTKLS